MKLHLGCGERYLQGYVNIDFPASEHSVQRNQVADVKCDFTRLTYPRSSIEEIRLHHVFEHFTRPVACALVAVWSCWLRPGGILRIEVPDFEVTALAALDPDASIHSKAVAVRHIFGSHEAAWAVHCEGWTTDRLSDLLKTCDLEPIDIEKNSWQDTHNFEIIAKKVAGDCSEADLRNRAREFLSSYLVDASAGEMRLLSVWMDMYDRQLSKRATDSHETVRDG